MGDFSDDYGGYDVLGLYEQRDEDRRAQRTKLLTPYAPPKYAIKTHWEKDGRIGVVVAIVRPDGGVHLPQDFVDPPKPQEKYTYGTPLMDAMIGKENDK